MKAAVFTMPQSYNRTAVSERRDSRSGVALMSVPDARFMTAAHGLSHQLRTEVMKAWVVFS